MPWKSFKDPLYRLQDSNIFRCGPECGSRQLKFSNPPVLSLLFRLNPPMSGSVVIVEVRDKLKCYCIENKSQLNLPNPASWIGQGKHPLDCCTSRSSPLPQLLLEMLLHSYSLLHDVRDCRSIEKSINILFDTFELKMGALGKMGFFNVFFWGGG